MGRRNPIHLAMNDFPGEPMLSQQRGVVVRQKLVEAEGGSMSAEETAKVLRLAKTTVLTRYKKGKLLAWRDGRRVRFPRWQFQGGKPLEGFEAVMTRLNEIPGLDDIGRLLFFLSNSSILGGKRPLDCLREGELNKVLQSAEGLNL